MMIVSDDYFESKVTLESESSPVPDDAPFHILLIGDWAGDSDYAKKDLADRRPVEIDRDEFDGVLRRINPKIELKFSGDADIALRLNFESLDDFHPDNIFRQLPLFADLRNLRRKLTKAETFNEAAAEVRSWYMKSNDYQRTNDDSDEPPAAQTVSDDGDLLDRILSGDQKNISVKRSAPKSELSELVSSIVAPHIVQTDTAEQSKLLAIVDEVVSDLMRKILHHPGFQRMEAAWRGLYFAVRRIETDSRLKIFLAQITKPELSANLSSVNNLKESTLYRWLITETSDAHQKESFAVIYGDYEFSPTVEDTATLIRIAKIAQSAVLPFISTVSPNVLGIKSFAENPEPRNWRISESSAEYKLWSTLRAISESSYLGMAMPRFMGRVPYGSDTEPTETFAFEEAAPEAEHDDYLWLNPCFAYAVALAKEYAMNGWNINYQTSFEMKDMPLHIYQINGETKVKSATETELTESNYDVIFQQGVMPLVSFRNDDKVRLSALRSISAFSPSLKGRWLG